MMCKDSGRIGFITCKYHLCLEEVELLIALILIIENSFCIRLKGERNPKKYCALK